MTKEIPLTKGYVAIVDDEDYEWLSQWKWTASEMNNTVYAMRQTNGTTVYMHRVILGAEKGVEVDHEDHNGLHNTRSNLRRATRVQNLANNRAKKSNQSGYKGVTLHRKSGRWVARIRVDGKRISMKYRETPEEAARDYDAAARKYFGEFAYLNFPDESPHV